MKIILYDLSGRGRLMHNPENAELKNEGGIITAEVRMRDRFFSDAVRMKIMLGYGEIFSGYILSQKYEKKGEAGILTVRAENELGRMKRHEAEPGILKNPSSEFIEERYLKKFGLRVEESFSLSGEMNIPMGTDILSLMDMIGRRFFGRKISIRPGGISFFGGHDRDEAEKLPCADEVSIEAVRENLCSRVFIKGAGRDGHGEIRTSGSIGKLERYFSSAEEIPEECLEEKKAIRLVYRGRAELHDCGGLISCRLRDEEEIFEVTGSGISAGKDGCFSYIEGKAV